MARPADTREHLLETAAHLIWSASYHATGVDRICEAAGVHKGSFYHHFSSKEELAIAALEEQWRRLKPRVDEIFSPATRPLDRLVGHARLTLELQREKQRQTGCVCGCPLYALGSEMGTLAPRLRAKIEELLEVRLRYLHSAVRDAQAAGEIVRGDALRTAHIVVDLTEGALMRARITNDLTPLVELEGALLSILVRDAALPARI